MRVVIYCLFAVFVASCSPENNLQKIITKAVNAGEKELVIPAGSYVINEPIVLDGVENLLITPDSSGRVRITSGMELDLDDFTCLDEEKGIYEITLSELISDRWPDSFRGYAGWPELYINGKPLQIARYPNDTYIQVDSVINPGSTPRTGDSSNIGARFISKELASIIASENIVSNDAKSMPLFLDGYWKYKWYDEVIRVESFDSESGEIKMAVPHRYGVGPPSGGLFYGINRLEFLDKAGEYYYNSDTGSLRFIMPNYAKKRTTITVGYQDFNMFEIKNCENIRFRDLEFRDHNGLLFSIIDSDSVVIQACRIRNMAQSAINITGGKDCGVVNSQLHSIGGTGISLNGGDKKTLTPARHFVKGSTISDFSRHVKTYSPAVKLDGVGHIVQRNSMSNGPHCAIHFTGNDHQIENNHIRHVCMNTSDAGAIYCGRDWTMGGTVIKNNSIQDLGKASHHHNWAIYLDDLASGIDVIDNYIIDCPSGILVGGGRYNRIIGNKMTNCPKASIMYDARGLNWYQPYLNDPKHTLWMLWNEVPVDQEPWISRFPWLKEIPNDDPAIPKHVEISDNEIFHSAVPQIHESVYTYGIVK
ncbi:MAG: right-handed parallel beta-helix repeat-containing protein [Bacteroidales bacterium]|nr:right-handed parallel beta-helix repeat-containing protein [Bacteroidales bacterium]